MVRGLWSLTPAALHRVVEDYSVAFFGSACFKLLRLFVFAAFNIHLFACIFYRVKDQDDDAVAVAQFYDARNVQVDVRFHAFFRELRRH